MNKYFKQIIIIAMLVMLVMSAGCSLETSSQPPSGLVISEVVSSNTNSLVDSVFGNPDWVELYNASDKAINLENYSISESVRNQYVFSDISIGPGEYLLVYCCEAIEGTDTDQCFTGFKLSKSGSKLTLTAPFATIQELTVPELETDISYGIGEDGKYMFFPSPTPGQANATQGFASLEEISTQQNDVLKISEILPQSVSDSDPYSWIELYNSGDKPIDLSNYYVTENLSDPKKAKLPNIELGAGEYTVLRFTGAEGDDEVPFKISAGETTVAVLNVFGIVVDRITWEAGLLAGISAGHGENGDVVYYTQPTPAQANSTNFTQSVSIADGVSDVSINEILLKNSYSIIDEDGERSSWVELRNTSGSAVNLGDYALSDDKNKLLRWRLPDTELAPDAYVILYLSGKDRIENELHANFKLGSDETQLFLTNLASCTVQTVDLPAETKDNIAFGLSADGSWLYYPQPTPLAPNSTQGFTEIAAAGGSSYLVINEVSSVSKAKSGDSDWVELYNGTPDDMDITGYYLSDSRSDLAKWPVGSASVSAGGYKVINRYEKEDASGELGISLSGETLYLSNAQGLVLDQFDTGVLRPGVSRGRLTDADTTSVAFFSTPTPGEPNSGDTVSGYCAAPLFSAVGGYQTSPVTLEMSAATPNASIYYTLDGSTPSPGSTPYTGPITVSQTQTVRAIAIADGKLASEETVSTYLFIREKHSLPVVCLSMTESDLRWVFGSQVRQDKRERTGYVEYYEADGTLGVRFPAGFRIAGAGTRTHAQKSINLYLRGGYGQSEVTYPFFEGYNITTFKSLSLRNMGQDYASTRLRDAYFHMAVNGMNIDNMQTKFAVVYINGEYYGLYEFKENQNEDYLVSKYGIDRDKIDMARNEWTFVGEKNIRHALNMSRGNMADADRFAEYTQIADSDYFMDYLIASTFFLSDDYYNQKYAHTSDNAIKWRPLFYDLDLALNSGITGFNLGSFFNPSGLNVGQIREDGSQTFVDTGLYYAFRKNPEWCDAFVKRYAEVMNTVLTEEKLISLFDEMAESARTEMPRTIEKWGKPHSMNYWEDQVASMRQDLIGRRKYVISGLKKYFDLSDDEISELFPNG